MAEKRAKAQRREAWGRLRQLPSKRWQARYTGPDGKVYSARTEGGQPLTFLTKTDAREFLNQAHAAIARGEWESPEDRVRRRQAEAAAAALRDVTFREYAGAWLERVRIEPGKGGRLRRPGSLITYRGRLNNQLMGPLGDLRMRDIDNEVVRTLTARLLALPSVLKPGAKQNGVAGDAIDILKMIMRAAVADGILPTMPVVHTPSRRSVRHDADHTPEDDVATPQQVDALYVAAPPHWRIAVLLAAWCQLRRGEVLGLQRRDVVWNLDRTAATLYVRRQKNGSTGQLADPKFEQGVRSMAVPPLMVERLRDHLDAFVGAGKTAPIVPLRVRGTEHLSTTTWNNAWAEAREQASCAARSASASRWSWVRESGTSANGSPHGNSTGSGSSTGRNVACPTRLPFLSNSKPVWAPGSWREFPRCWPSGMFTSYLIA